jgi:hypothetical protein
MRVTWVVPAIAIAAVGLSKVHCSRQNSSPSSKSEHLLVDRIWVDRMPIHDYDVVNVLTMDAPHSLGDFFAMSQWKGEFETFTFEIEDDEIHLVYGQTGQPETVKARVRECGENHFDYCLELSGNSRGVSKYYSLKGWEIDRVSLDQILRKLRALVRATQR